jgi:putative ribosome biogenesis GTPase RsgA
MILTQESRTAQTKRKPHGVHHKYHMVWPWIEPGLSLNRLKKYWVTFSAGNVST